MPGEIITDFHIIYFVIKSMLIMNKSSIHFNEFRNINIRYTKCMLCMYPIVLLLKTTTLILLSVSDWSIANRKLASCRGVKIGRTQDFERRKGVLVRGP